MFSSATDEEKPILATNAKSLLLAFKSLKSNTDSRVLIRELVFDKHIPYQVKRRVIPMLAGNGLDNWHLIKSLIDLGADADQMMLVFAPYANTADMQNFIGLIAMHPKADEMLRYIFRKQLNSNWFGILVRSTPVILCHSAYIARKFLPALGAAIVERAGKRGSMREWFTQMDPKELTRLLPVLFHGVLTEEQIDDLNDSILNIPALPRFN